MKRQAAPETLRKEPHQAIPVRLLHVSADEGNRLWMQHLLGSTRWTFRQVRDLDDAIVRLKSEPFSVVICERRLLSGHWKVLHEYARRLPDPPAFVVAAPVTDIETWAEALNLGANDVLASPHDRKEVVCVVSEAHNSWLRAIRRRERNSSAWVA